MELPADLGARMRAARAYASAQLPGGQQMSRDKLAKAVGWRSATTIQRIEDGARDFDAIELEAVLPKIARECGLPGDFFTAQWDQVGTTEPTDEQPAWVGRLEEKVNMILDTLQGGRDALRDIAADTSSQRTLAELAARTELPAPSRRGNRRSD